MEYDIIHELPYGNRKELIRAISCRYSVCLWLTWLWKELESEKNIQRPRNKEAKYEKRGRETEYETLINNAKIFTHI